MTALDVGLVVSEFNFLKDNPQFEQRPASIIEFLGPEYLNIRDKVRPGIRKSLVRIFGDTVSPIVISRVRRAVFSGGIGIGKTTVASIIMTYMVHWVSCLKDPQDYFNLMDGSRIAFMLMSTSESQAKEVLFGDIKARINNSPWFRNNCQPDKDFRNQLRFPKDIWVLPGNSQETSFEGYNILGGILDEGDSHKKTRDKDYAEQGYDTIHSRIDSRFNDPATEDHRGLLVAIGQMKSSSGFMATKRDELEKDPNAYVSIMSIWESIGWNNYLKPNGDRNSFWYDIKRKQIVPEELVALIKNDSLIEVPASYRKNFVSNPEKALRDLAGIPPAVDDPFISMVDRIEECTERWIESHRDASGRVPVPVDDNPVSPAFASDLVATDSLRRALHLDIAVSAEGDALGLAMGHVSKLVEIDDELKPYIVFDFLLRMKAPAGKEIILGDVRRILYELKEDRHYKIKSVTMDGFQSTDSMQQLRRRRIPSSYLSVDKTLIPYYDLREAIYERRIEFPPYLTHVNVGDVEVVEIARRELMQLTEVGHKVDHPKKGSKDVTDAMAGVVYTLMGDRAYRRIARPAATGYHAPDTDLQPSMRDGSVILSPLGMPVGSVRGGIPAVPVPRAGAMSDWGFPPTSR